tara:strand:+ start:157 stop:774 length:618 start_codon:yes stop_codon:yes gene_type:complete
MNKTTEAFQSGSDDSDLLATHDLVDTKDKLLTMFDSLDEAEKRCDLLESQQFQREQKSEMLNNDKIYKELQEQDKKIHELKEIVKYLTIEKKRRDKINNSCKATKQRKLNDEYNIVKSLNDTGVIRDNSVSLDLNISDSDKMKQLLQNLNKNGTNNEGSNRSDASKCTDKGDGHIDLNSIGGKCHGCDAAKLKEQMPWISNSFDK